MLSYLPEKNNKLLTNKLNRMLKMFLKNGYLVCIKSMFENTKRNTFKENVDLEILVFLPDSIYPNFNKIYRFHRSGSNVGSPRGCAQSCQFGPKASRICH